MTTSTTTSSSSSLRTMLTLLLASLWMFMLMVYEASERMETPMSPSAIVISSASLDKASSYSNEKDELQKQKLKSILFFTPFFHLQDYGFGLGHAPFVKHQCPIDTCFTTRNMSLLSSVSEFDAVVFHMRNMFQTEPFLPAQRKPSQRYVMFLMESPVHDDFPYDQYTDFFNWTMTYRRDSDIYRPYGWIGPKKERKKEKSFEYADNSKVEWLAFDEKVFRERLAVIRAEEQKTGIKTPQWAFPLIRDRKVAWIVSNCHTESGRERFVDLLADHIDVDIMGNCGKDKCDRKHANDGPMDNCSARAYEHSSFYLSLENSLCRDYVTEKFFKRIANNIVPIVLNASASGLSAVAPPHSYIDASEFASPGSLADFLANMDLETYLSYHWWREHYEVRFGWNHGAQAMCKLCAMLHNQSLGHKSYSDMNHWWHRQAHCTPGRFGGKTKREKDVVTLMKEGLHNVFNVLNDHVATLNQLTNHFYGKHEQRQGR